MTSEKILGWVDCLNCKGRQGLECDLCDGLGIIRVVDLTDE